MKINFLPSLSWLPLTILVVFFLGAGLITGRYWGESDFMAISAKQSKQTYLETFFQRSAASWNLSEPIEAGELLAGSEQFFAASKSGLLAPGLLVMSKTTEQPTNIVLKDEYYRWLTEAELVKLED